MKTTTKHNFTEELSIFAAGLTFFLALIVTGETWVVPIPFFAVGGYLLGRYT